MTYLKWREFAPENANWTISLEQEETGFFRAAKRTFIRSYKRPSKAEKILESLQSSDFLPLVLRYDKGRSRLLEMIFDVAELISADGDTFDHDLATPEGIMLLLVLSKKVPEPSDFAPFWQRLTERKNTSAEAEAGYWWLVEKLPSANEWVLRELVLRSGFLLDRIDDQIAFQESFSKQEFCDTILRNYKQLNNNTLNDDFDKAGQEHINRRYRFAPKTGKGGVHKQVKLTLHEDVIPVVAEAVGEGNRSAWIEQAIVEKLERDGFKFTPPDYSDLKPES